MSDQTITDKHHGHGGSFVLNDAGERVLAERTRDSVIDPETGERQTLPDAVLDAPREEPAPRRKRPETRDDTASAASVVGQP